VSSPDSVLNPAPPLRTRRTLRATLGTACDAACLATLAYLVVSRVFYDDFDVGQEFGIDRVLLIVVAFGLVVLRRLAVRTDLRLTLAGFAVLASTFAAMAILPLLGVGLVDPLRAVVTPIRFRLGSILSPTNRPLAIHRLDDRYGYVHVPNSTAQQSGRGFTATYTIDAEGHRVMPSPPAPRGTVVFLGDSVTFGWGVDDANTYPYVLATEYWKDLRITNAAVDGWGLTQCFLALVDTLARPPYPDLVVLAIIDHDLRRSHLRLITGQRKRLEWIDRRFVLREFQGDPSPVVETRGLLEQEAQLARATLVAMAAEARAKGVTFAVTLLGDGGEFPPDVIYALGRDGVPTLDLTRLGQSALPYDFHPDAAGHRAIAAAIAASHLTPLVHQRARESR
jgi:hypothetical protein